MFKRSIQRSQEFAVQSDPDLALDIPLESEDEQILRPLTQDDTEPT